ncbi:nicotinamide-nucleotide amidase [Loktanella ponticola]|uniref:Nicotinamide-nucleotide amidase n=1 Tax=Yoonia ponticola TaxID=1524255 RepID=A0A7W9BJV0_9RHOB|nr:CinA family protein [Yoonia ponticola]MBB5721893.1 nicotinamide-nucleotide amidase [Yoonia ponticola]
MTTAADILALATAKGVMIATAESCTGGLISGALTDIAGSSAMFDRGFVTYSNAAKTDLLGVPAAMIAAHGAVSEDVAAAMAQGALARSAAQIAVSVTGVAGPGGSDAKPEGMVCFGVATAQGVQVETVQFGAIGRANVRAKTVEHALGMIAAALTAI